MNKKAKPYAPPIPWKRFGAMCRAIHAHVYDKRPLDNATALEIYDAVWRLYGIYQAELTASLPNRRTSDADLRAATLAVWLMEWYKNVNAGQALWAATGERPKNSPESTARTLRNRAAKGYLPTLEETERAVARIEALGLRREK